MTTLLAIITTAVAGLLTLWRDELTYTRSVVPEDETASERSQRLKAENSRRRTARYKVISTSFIAVTFALSWFQISADRQLAEQSKRDKERQHFAVALDGMDTLLVEQMRSFDEQLRAAGAIGGIRGMTDKIVTDLDGARTSVKELIGNTRTLIYALDDDITMQLQFEFWDPVSEDHIESYLEQHPVLQMIRQVPITDRFPNVQRLSAFLDGIELKVIFQPHGVLPMSDQDELLVLKGEERFAVMSTEAVTGGRRSYDIYYDRDRKSINILSFRYPLEIERQQSALRSILDYENKDVVVRIDATPTPTSLDPNLDSSRMSVRFDFSQKVTTSFYGELSHTALSGGTWWDYHISRIKFRLP
jgi:hypothetical protein